MNRLLFIVCVFLSISISVGASAETIITSFPCDGKISQHEKPQRYSYQITGKRLSQHVKMCVSSADETCKTFQIHKFDINCDGKRVEWANVAKHRLNHGHEIVLGSHTKAVAIYRQGQILIITDQISSDRKRQVYTQLPAGYAPTFEIGARVQPSGNAGASHASQTKERATFRFISSAEAAENSDIYSVPLPSAVSINKVAQFASSSPLYDFSETQTDQQDKYTDRPRSQGSLSSAPSQFRTLTGLVQSLTQAEQDQSFVIASAGSMVSPSNRWSTTVIEAANHRPAINNQRIQKSVIATLLALALLTSVISGIGWFTTQRLLTQKSRKSDPYKAALQRELSDFTRPDAQMCGELCRTGEALIGDIQTRIDQMQSAGPLRHVLTREVTSMGQFLSKTVRKSPEDQREWRRLRLRLERVVTDLIRLKDITDGARRSLKSRVLSEELPRDRKEAYEILGANPEASARVLKRLVDALRATWHPDLAVNEEDREMRDHRIKQINVAWDIITGKRI